MFTIPKEYYLIFNNITLEDFNNLKEFNNLIVNFNDKIIKNKFSFFCNRAFELNKILFDHYCNEDFDENEEIIEEEIQLENEIYESSMDEDLEEEEIEIASVDKIDFFSEINCKITNNTIKELNQERLNKIIINSSFKSIAEFVLGYHYMGIGTIRDTYMKYKLFLRSAENDNYLAQYSIGLNKLKILSKIPNNELLESSMSYYLLKSYNNGYIESGYKLCSFLIKKQLDKKFYFTEYQWKFLLDLSEKDIKTNLFLMNVYSFFPDSCSYHESKILSHYYKAIELDSLMCHNILGSIYYRRKDYNKAFSYYKKGSEIGDFCSSYNVGFMYYYGQDVEKNIKLSQQYFKLSLEQFNIYDSIFRTKYPLFKKQLEFIIKNNIFIKPITITEDDSCCICYNSFINNNEKILILECGHFFHVKCVLKCDNCPICRRVFE